MTIQINRLDPAIDQQSPNLPNMMIIVRLVACHTCEIVRPRSRKAEQSVTLFGTFREICVCSLWLMRLLSRKGRLCDEAVYPYDEASEKVARYCRANTNAMIVAHAYDALNG